MIGLSLRRVNPRPLLLALVAGCAAPPRSAAPPPVPAAEVALEPQRTPDAHGTFPVARLPGAHLSDLPAFDGRRSYLVDEESIMLKLAAPLSDVGFEEDGGDEIDAALEGFSRAEISNYGAGLLTSVQLFGDPFHASICEAPELRVSVDDQAGKPWELALELPQYTAFVGDPEPVMSGLSDACIDGVATSGGDAQAAVDGGDCDEAELHQFFEPGSACGSCVAGNGGDYAACIDDAACTAEAPQVTWVLEDGEKAWYQLVQATAWACRPDWLSLVYLLARVPPDGTLPESYDHADWNYYCFPLYDPVSDSVNYSCDAGDGPEIGSTLGEGIFGRTLWMEDGDGNRAHEARAYYTPRIDLETGARIRWSWASSSNIGRLSKPFTIADSNGDGVSGEGDDGYGYPGAGWGINPHALRPGGTDPTSLDDTYARDWLALAVLKNATTMDGIPISVSNFSRCSAWEGPDADGSDRCLVMDPPSGGWLNDGLHYGETLEDGQTYSYVVPILTIGSTGLPDPDIPGGIVPLIAGSNRLSEPEWDDCAWPHSFVADQVPFPDVPWDYGGSASLWGDGYHFGKDPELDLRMVLNTNIARHYCPEDPR